MYTLSAVTDSGNRRAGDGLESGRCPKLSVTFPSLPSTPFAFFFPPLCYAPLLSLSFFPLSSHPSPFLLSLPPLPSFSTSLPSPSLFFSFIFFFICTRLLLFLVLKLLMGCIEKKTPLKQLWTYYLLILRSFTRAF